MCKGPTLTIMQSNEEPNSFFGGMAASSWNSSANFYSKMPYKFSDIASN